MKKMKRINTVTHLFNLFISVTGLIYFGVLFIWTNFQIFIAFEPILLTLVLVSFFYIYMMLLATRMMVMVFNDLKERYAIIK